MIFFNNGGVHSPPKNICETYSAKDTAPIAAESNMFYNNDNDTKNAV